MSPEYGATAALFPVDDNSLRYLRETNRGDVVDLVERYTRAQGLFRTDADPHPTFSELVELELGEVEPSLAGPKRPQDRGRPRRRVRRRSRTAFGPARPRPRTGGSAGTGRW